MGMIAERYSRFVSDTSRTTPTTPATHTPSGAPDVRDLSVNIDKYRVITNIPINYRIDANHQNHC